MGAKSSGAALMISSSLSLYTSIATNPLTGILFVSNPGCDHYQTQIHRACFDQTQIILLPITVTEAFQPGHLLPLWTVTRLCMRIRIRASLCLGLVARCLLRVPIVGIKQRSLYSRYLPNNPKNLPPDPPSPCLAASFSIHFVRNSLFFSSSSLYTFVSS